MNGNSGDEHRYDEIIQLPHPTSKTHPRMSAMDRAAQFSPFAALTGYGEAVEETARMTEARREAGEEEKAQLDAKLRLAQERLRDRISVRIVWFRPDERKQGGAYVTAEGVLRRVLPAENLLILEDGTRIRMDSVTDLQGSLFDGIGD